MKPISIVDGRYKVLLSVDPDDISFIRKADRTEGIILEVGLKSCFILSLPFETMDDLEHAMSKTIGKLEDLYTKPNFIIRLIRLIFGDI